MFDIFKRKPDQEDARPWSERLASGSRDRVRSSPARSPACSRGASSTRRPSRSSKPRSHRDVGVAATQHLLDDLSRGGSAPAGDADPKALLKAAFVDLLQPLERPLTIGAARPFVIMLAGVNGAGKTTSIGKLAKYFQAQGHSVLLAAGDTFRAAAASSSRSGGDAMASRHIPDGRRRRRVMFDAIGAATRRGIDVVLADTAGRLPTQLNLMEEIRKVQRVIRKAGRERPARVLLVLDANTGQNALAQVKRSTTRSA
jgi:fused signal recognition particle receptor